MPSRLNMPWLVSVPRKAGHTMNTAKDCFCKPWRPVEAQAVSELQRAQEAWDHHDAISVRRKHIRQAARQPRRDWQLMVAVVKQASTEALLALQVLVITRVQTRSLFSIHKPFMQAGQAAQASLGPSGGTL